MSQLTNHFSLEELSFTQHREFDNIPPPEVMPALTRTAQGLERIRSLLGHPIHVNSGYRSPQVNAAVGSKPTSQHMKGEAADFICPGYGTPLVVAERIREKIVDLGVDQLIWEFSAWCHVSFTEHPRHSVLTIDRNGTRNGLA